MDFGVGFLSNKVMLPILDFFYGIVPSYGLAIIFLTLVIRFALYPLNVGSIRNMRKMKVVNPLMQKRMKEIQQKYADDPQKLREAQSKIYSELQVNPLGGCLPLFIQMPVLFALFATLRGSPFAAATFDINLQLLEPQAAAEIVFAPSTSAPKNVFLTETTHRPLLLVNPKGSKLAVGDQVKFQIQSETGMPLADLLTETEADPARLTPTWTVTKGEDRVQLEPDGTLVALAPGDVTIQASIPGLAAETGFLFIEKLGHVGAFDEDGTPKWDILGMIAIFGASIFVNTSLTAKGNDAADANSSQNSLNKITPVLLSGMFLFFPLPAGVLLYIVVSNIFQTVQTYILSLEPLPENLQKLVDEERQTGKANTQVVDVEAEAVKPKKKAKSDVVDTGRESLPFEP
jgi:YidC/Oxa1 family membrane protein insertase